MTILADPAASLVGKPMTESVEATAGLTTSMLDSVSVRLAVAVSVAVIDFVPAAKRVTAKVCRPASAAVKV